MTSLVSTHETKTWQPVELKHEITHPQPMTGLVLWPETARRLHETYGQAIQLEFSYCLPCKVVTGCHEDGTIEYDWSWFDHILDDVASRGHQLIARFRYEYPSSRDVDGKRGTTAVPAYIKQRQDYSETFAENPNNDGPTWYADWSNTELQCFTLQFYTNFAHRYAHDPRLAFLEVGFGHWSEYHIYGTKLELGKNFPSKTFQKQFYEHMSTIMTDIPWAVSIDAGDRRYSPVDAIGRGTRWQHGVCGGEISYYSPNDQRNFLCPEGMYGHTWVEQAAKYHITFMISNDAPRGGVATPEKFREGSMATGYRFVVRQCETNGTVTRLRVTNEGVAPIYRDAWFAIGNTRSATSLRGLLPGDEFMVEIPAVPRTDGTDVHIVSDHILPQQQIEFEAK